MKQERQFSSFFESEIGDIRSKSPRSNFQPRLRMDVGMVSKATSPQNRIILPSC